MQGSIFTAFADMIIEKAGMSEWNQLIEETKLPSQGIYTSSGRYNDMEMIVLVQLLSKKTGKPIEKLLQEFGQYLFAKLYNTCPADLSKIRDLREFLLSIDQLIHSEVKRLNPDASPPHFEFEKGTHETLIMYYRSKRKLCHVNLGLLEGAAEKFNESVSIEHTECMHNGAARCKFIIHFKR